jgi:natural product precursor
MQDFQLKIIGEISTKKLSKKEVEHFKGGQWLCNCTCRLAGSITAWYSFGHILETFITIIALFNCYTYITGN